MNDRPPLLPVLLGVAAIGLGLVNGSCFTFWTWAFSLPVTGEGPDDAGPPPTAFTPTQFGLLAAFAVLQIPAGIGVLRHRPWGLGLLSATALGTVIVATLGAGLGLLGGDRTRGLYGGVMSWGVLTGVPWAIIVSLASRSRAARAIFGGGPARVGPNGGRGR